MRTWPELKHMATRKTLAKIARIVRRNGATIDDTRVLMAIRAIEYAREAKRFPHRLRAESDQRADTETLQTYIAAGSARPATLADATYTLVDCRLSFPEAPLRMAQRKTPKRARHTNTRFAHRWPYGHGRTW